MRKGNNDAYLNMEVSWITYCWSHLVQENDKEYESLSQFNLFAYYYVKLIRKEKNSGHFKFDLVLLENKIKESMK